MRPISRFPAATGTTQTLSLTPCCIPNRAEFRLIWPYRFKSIHPETKISPGLAHPGKLRTGADWWPISVSSGAGRGPRI